MPRQRTWTDGELSEAVSRSRSKRDVLIRLNLRPTGGNYKQLEKYINELNLGTDHFLGQGWNKGLQFHPNTEVSLEKILALGSTFESHKLKKRLFKAGLKKELCEACGWAVQSEDGRVPLELNHKNGDHFDNRIENLEILCPNCHSLKPHYRGSKLKK